MAPAWYCARCERLMACLCLRAGIARGQLLGWRHRRSEGPGRGASFRQQGGEGGGARAHLTRCALCRPWGKPPEMRPPERAAAAGSQVPSSCVCREGGGGGEATAACTAAVPPGGPDRGRVCPGRRRGRVCEIQEAREAIPGPSRGLASAPGRRDGRPGWAAATPPRGSPARPPPRRRRRSAPRTRGAWASRGAAPSAPSRHAPRRARAAGRRGRARGRISMRVRGRAARRRSGCVGRARRYGPRRAAAAAAALGTATPWGQAVCFVRGATAFRGVRVCSSGAAAERNVARRSGCGSGGRGRAYVGDRECRHAWVSDARRLCTCTVSLPRHAESARRVANTTARAGGDAGVECIVAAAPAHPHAAAGRSYPRLPAHMFIAGRAAAASSAPGASRPRSPRPAPPRLKALPTRLPPPRRAAASRRRPSSRSRAPPRAAARPFPFPRPGARMTGPRAQPGSGEGGGGPPAQPTVLAAAACGGLEPWARGPGVGAAEAGRRGGMRGPSARGQPLPGSARAHASLRPPTHPRTTAAQAPWRPARSASPGPRASGPAGVSWAGHARAPACRLHALQRRSALGAALAALARAPAHRARPPAAAARAPRRRQPRQRPGHPRGGGARRHQLAPGVPRPVVCR
jgi:hypothetical protein